MELLIPTTTGYKYAIELFLDIKGRLPVNNDFASNVWKFALDKTSTCYRIVKIEQGTNFSVIYVGHTQFIVIQQDDLSVALDTLENEQSGTTDIISYLKRKKEKLLEELRKANDTYQTVSRDIDRINQEILEVRMNIVSLQPIK